MTKIALVILVLVSIYMIVATILGQNFLLLIVFCLVGYFSLGLNRNWIYKIDDCGIHVWKFPFKKKVFSYNELVSVNSSDGIKTMQLTLAFYLNSNKRKPLIGYLEVKSNRRKMEVLNFLKEKIIISKIFVRNITGVNFNKLNGRFELD